MDKIIASVKDFLSTGNNLTLVIIIAVLVFALLLAMIIASIKKKKVEKKVREEEALVAEEEAKEASSFNIETITLSPIVEEEDEKVLQVGDNKTAYQIADEAVIMTPIREKKRPIKKQKNKKVLPMERKSSFSEPTPSPDDGKRPGNIQIYKDLGGKFRFRFRSSNMNTVGHSQGYTAKSACKSGIQAVIRAAEKAMISDSTKEDYVSVIGKASFEIYKDKEGKFRFRLIAANASNVLASQGYTTKANCMNGVESIKKIAEFHTISDDTLIK